MDKYTAAKQIAERSSFITRNYKTSNLPWLWFRVLRPLLKGYNRLWRMMKGQVPWTSPASILIFDKILDKTMSGFEYGSGRSTLFFAKKLKDLVSVEHDEGWYNLVSDQVRALNNVEYLLIKPSIQNDITDYSDYADIIKKYNDNSFDFILVDGRWRVTCIKNAIPKLRSGGILVLDNSEREAYKEVFDLLRNWKKVNTTTGLTDTTLWFKP